VGMISRMVDQKGFDLIASLAGDLPALDAGFVVLGTGEPRYQDMWRKLAAGYPDRIAVTIGFDEGLAHLIEGGADIFLMPSQWEPCGLNQMYSLRYGTVPVVRGVGGLADTVRDYASPPSGPALPAGTRGPAQPGGAGGLAVPADQTGLVGQAGPPGQTGLEDSAGPAGRQTRLAGQTGLPGQTGPGEPTGLTRPQGSAGSTASTGFVFNEYTPAALLHALERALLLFKDKQKWQALQVAGMKEDHSWDRSAREYVKIYECALGLPGLARGRER
jgi:glycogen synthase